MTLRNCYEKLVEDWWGWVGLGWEVSGGSWYSDGRMSGVVRKWNWMGGGFWQIGGWLAQAR